jgi:hypothetical protein
MLRANSRLAHECEDHPGKSPFRLSFNEFLSTRHARTASAKPAGAYYLELLAALRGATFPLAHGIA